MDNLLIIHSLNPLWKYLNNGQYNKKWTINWIKQSAHIVIKYVFHLGIRSTKYQYIEYDPHFVQHVIPPIAQYDQSPGPWGGDWSLEYSWFGPGGGVLIFNDVLGSNIGLNILIGTDKWQLIISKGTHFVGDMETYITVNNKQTKITNLFFSISLGSGHANW